jgi:hypothetical protein
LSLLPRVTLPVIAAIRGIALVGGGILPCSIVIGAAIALRISVAPVVIRPLAVIGSRILASRILPARILLMIPLILIAIASGIVSAGTWLAVIVIWARWAWHVPSMILPIVLASFTICDRAAVLAIIVIPPIAYNLTTMFSLIGSSAVLPIRP